MICSAGIEAVHYCAEVLSGDHDQSFVYARFLSPLTDYTIFEETFSDISVDVEALLCKRVKETGITLISLSHRSSLRLFQDKVLKFDGAGGCQYCEIRTDDVSHVLAKKIRLEEGGALVPSST